MIHSLHCTRRHNCETFPRRGINEGILIVTVTLWRSHQQSVISQRARGASGLTAGAAGEAAVVVEAPHGLAGLAGSEHRLLALHAHS